MPSSCSVTFLARKEGPPRMCARASRCQMLQSHLLFVAWVLWKGTAETCFLSLVCVVVFAAVYVKKSFSCQRGSQHDNPNYRGWISKVLQHKIICCCGECRVKVRVSTWSVLLWKDGRFSELIRTERIERKRRWEWLIETPFSIFVFPGTFSSRRRVAVSMGTIWSPCCHTFVSGKRSAETSSCGILSCVWVIFVWQSVCFWTSVCAQKCRCCRQGNSLHTSPRPHPVFLGAWRSGGPLLCTGDSWDAAFALQAVLPKIFVLPWKSSPSQIQRAYFGDRPDSHQPKKKKNWVEHPLSSFNEAAGNWASFPDLDQKLLVRTIS